MQGGALSMKIHEVIGSKVGLDIRDGGNNFFCMNIDNYILYY